MAHETDTNSRPESADQDVSQRVQSLREKTAALDETLNEIEEHLEDARAGVKE